MFRTKIYTCGIVVKQLWKDCEIAEALKLIAILQKPFENVVQLWISLTCMYHGGKLVKLLRHHCKMPPSSHNRMSWIPDTQKTISLFRILAIDVIKLVISSGSYAKARLRSNVVANLSQNTYGMHLHSFTFANFSDPPLKRPVDGQTAFKKKRCPGHSLQGHAKAVQRQRGTGALLHSRRLAGFDVAVLDLNWD